jgi:hypothetical protein
MSSNIYGKKFVLTLASHGRKIAVSSNRDDRKHRSEFTRGFLWGSCCSSFLSNVL